VCVGVRERESDQEQIFKLEGNWCAGEQTPTFFKLFKLKNNKDPAQSLAILMLRPQVLYENENTGGTSY